MSKLDKKNTKKINNFDSKSLKEINKKNQKDLMIKEYNPKKKFKNFSILFSDIETIIENDQHKPVIITIIDNCNNVFTFDSIDDYMLYLILNCRRSIIYFHNFGRFDSTFILKWLVKNKEKAKGVEIIERNNIIYQIKINSCNIYFRDSYLIIPLSLKSIGETFCQKYQKDKFEYENISNIYKKNPSKVKELCINDCKVLQEGFNKFSELVKNEFNIDLYGQLTLPSLAFNIFKYKYYNSIETPISKNPYKEDEFIRRSYAGGISEVFKPYLNKGYCYDANSLYPFVMKNFKYPVGKGKFVNPEDIDIKNFIGFIECEVTLNKEVNFLTYRDPEKGLITPIGRWRSVYFHAEIKKALSLGYKIKFIKGFKYEKEKFIFKNYVEKLYQIRKTAKNKSMNSIAKLLLNSLYGRFGMKIFIETTKFIKASEIQLIKKTHEITNVHYLGNDLYTVSCRKKSITDKDLFKDSINTETAVQIASAVTSYARVYMYDFKNIENNECYYTDTDSIFLKEKLDDKFLGNDLGKFKLEYEIDEGYFIAPKVYYVKLKNNENKIVVKGLKKEEYSGNDLIKIFKNIIKGENSSLKIYRENPFKRNLLELITFIQKINLKFDFPFNKRIKVFDKNNKWINTRALKIKKY